MDSKELWVLIALAVYNFIGSIFQGITGFGDIITLQILWQVSTSFAPSIFHSTPLGTDNVRAIACLSYVRIFFMQCALLSLLLYQEYKTNRLRKLEGAVPLQSNFNWWFTCALTFPTMIGAYVGIVTLSAINENALRIVFGCSSFFFGLTFVSLNMMQRLEERRISNVVAEDLVLMRISQSVNEDSRTVADRKREQRQRARRRRREERQRRMLAMFAVETLREADSRGPSPNTPAPIAPAMITVTSPQNEVEVVHHTPNIHHVTDDVEAGRDGEDGGNGRVALGNISVSSASSNEEAPTQPYTRHHHLDVSSPPLPVIKAVEEKDKRSLSCSRTSTPSDPAADSAAREGKAKALAAVNALDDPSGFSIRSRPSMKLSTTSTPAATELLHPAVRRPGVPAALSLPPATTDGGKRAVALTASAKPHTALAAGGVHDVGDAPLPRIGRLAKLQRSRYAADAIAVTGDDVAVKDGSNNLSTLSQDLEAIPTLTPTQRARLSPLLNDYIDLSALTMGSFVRTRLVELSVEAQRGGPSQLHAAGVTLEAMNRSPLDRSRRSSPVGSRAGSDAGSTSDAMTFARTMREATARGAHEVNIGLREVQQHQLEGLMQPKKVKKVRSFAKVDGAVLAAAAVSSFFAGLLGSYTGVGFPPQTIFVLAMRIDGALFRVNFSASTILPAVLRLISGVAEELVKAELMPYYLVTVLFGWGGLLVGVKVGQRAGPTGFMVSVLVCLFLVAFMMVVSSPWVLLCVTAAAVGIVAYVVKREGSQPEHRRPPVPPNTPTTEAERAAFEAYWQRVTFNQSPASSLSMSILSMDAPPSRDSTVGRRAATASATDGNANALDRSASDPVDALSSFSRPASIHHCGSRSSPPPAPNPPAQSAAKVVFSVAGSLPGQSTTAPHRPGATTQRIVSDPGERRLAREEEDEELVLVPVKVKK